jgi:hypothetical protein
MTTRRRHGVLVAALVAVVALGVAACGGGDKDAAPLTLEQRVPGEADAPGSEADPVETPISVATIEDAGSLPELLFTPEEEDVTAMEDAGFVSARVDTRFFPSQKGAEHVGDEVHVATLVMQLASDEEAADIAALLHDDGLEPCPGSCAVNTSEFEVDDIPNAQGGARIQTAERLKSTGAEGDPFSAYSISFADGPFAYKVTMFAFGPPARVSQEQVDEIADSLYQRVEDAPPAQQ